MTRSHRLSSPARLLAAALLLTGSVTAVQAQNTDNSRRDTSWIPYTHNGYVGINLGQPHYPNSCGILPGLSCDNSDLSAKLSVGGMFNNVIGLELAYIYFGNADRAGGTTEAQGLNISLVGRVPITSMFSVFAKGGTTYGHTRVSASPLSGVPTGSAKGWGGSYGAGLSFDMNPRSSVVLEWERHNLQFPGAGRQGIKTTSVGYVHRF